MKENPSYLPQVYKENGMSESMHRDLLMLDPLGFGKLDTYK
jgi:hypothetical protein